MGPNLHLRGPYQLDMRDFTNFVADQFVTADVVRSFGLSQGALALTGAFDAISVVIRDTMELTLTPDVMRGRVGSVHYIFMGMSNDFGEFESGVAAALLGAMTSVVLGSVGTLLVVPAIALLWPEVRRLRRIEGPRLQKFAK